jgi:7-keto-8-aminopelargonate synthetase-like enzyme
LKLDCGQSETPIIPIMTHDEFTTLALVRDIQKDGVLVFGVLPPAVLPGTCRIRICANAAMTTHDVDRALEIMGNHLVRADERLSCAI